ncbi:hypothetical protein Hanom_Chr13g01187851 [Helianthus anomalus]
MVRTKERAGASSSSSSSKGKGKQPEQQPKKRRYLGRDDDSESEEEMMELDPADKPREVREVEFGPFNVFAQFRALGWEAALSCYNKDNKNLFIDEIQEWMAALKCNRYDKPSQMKLTGTVNGIKVEMSFDTLRKLAKFDSLPARDYTIPGLDDLLIKPKQHSRWNDMLATLFLPGDKQEVRYPEILVLYSLLHGSPRFLIRYLIMNHLWLCRNKVGGASFRIGGVKRHKPFNIQRIGILWTYDQSERYHKLKSEEQRWRALKVDARALLPAEEDEPESEDEPPSGDEDYADAPHGEHLDVGQGGPSRGYGGGFFDYTEWSYEPNWAYDGTMQEIVENQRPPASVFDTWSGPERTFFDHQPWMGDSLERALKHNFDWQDLWNRTHAYSHELEMNNRYNDDQAWRMYTDWHAGRPVVVDPPPVDYASLPPYDGSVSYPTPTLHDSQWMDPRQQQHGASRQSESRSGSGAFAFGEWNDMMSSIFWASSTALLLVRLCSFRFVYVCIYLFIMFMVGWMGIV